MTTREIVYYILDLVKQSSDDAFYTEEHVVFAITKHRAFLLEQKQKQDLLFKPLESNYQTVCVDLEQYSPFDGSTCGEETYLRSTKPLPSALSMSNTSVYPMDFYRGTKTIFVSNERMKFVGYNKWMSNFIYCSLDPDQYLTLKSSNSNFLELKKAKFSGIFEDFEKAAELSCEDDCDCDDNCDPLDKDFPLQADLVPLLIDSVMKELLGASYRPKDDANNSADDLADLVAFIRRNTKSALAKQMTEA